MILFQLVGGAGNLFTLAGIPSVSLFHSLSHIRGFTSVITQLHRAGLRRALAVPTLFLPLRLLPCSSSGATAGPQIRTVKSAIARMLRDRDTRPGADLV